MARDDTTTQDAPEGHDPNAERLAAEEAERDAAAAELAGREAQERKAEEARVAEVDRIAAVREHLLQRAAVSRRVHERMRQMVGQGRHGEDDLAARKADLRDHVRDAKAKLREHPELKVHASDLGTLDQYVQVMETHRQLADRLEELAR